MSPKCLSAYSEIKMRIYGAFMTIFHQRSTFRPKSVLCCFVQFPPSLFLGRLNEKKKKVFFFYTEFLLTSHFKINLL